MVVHLHISADAPFWLASLRSLPACAGRAPKRHEVDSLGTGGGPRPRKASAGSAHVIVSGGVAYVIDCGDGVARQLAFAGVPFPSLRHVFITHQHSDHTADYGNLILLAWAAGLDGVDTWGPPPLARMTQLFFEMNASDIDVRVANEGRSAACTARARPRASRGRRGDVPAGTSRSPPRSSIIRRWLRRSPTVRRARPLDRHLRRHRAVAEPRKARQRRGRPGPLGDVSASDRPPGRPRNECRNSEDEHPCPPDISRRRGSYRTGGWGQDAGALPTSCRPTIRRSPTRCGVQRRRGTFEEPSWSGAIPGGLSEGLSATNGIELRPVTNALRCDGQADHSVGLMWMSANEAQSSSRNASGVPILTAVAIGRLEAGPSDARMGREGSRDLPRWTRGVVDNLAERGA